MGSELLFDPWNPHVLIVPCLALLACAWSIGCGGWRALPVYVAIGSFCVQTHLGYVYLVPGLLVVAVVVGVVLRRTVPVADGPPARPLPSRGVVLTTVIVAAVLWVQPFWEQLFGAGEGNLSRLAGAAGLRRPEGRCLARRPDPRLGARCRTVGGAGRVPRRRAGHAVRRRPACSGRWTTSPSARRSPASWWSRC